MPVDVEVPDVAASLFEPVGALQFISESVQSPRWAVEGVWPEGAAGVIGGAPKNGKSSFGLELAVSLATRSPFLGLKQFPVQISPVPVLYVQVENSRGRVQRDLQEILAARGLGHVEEEVVDHRGFVTNPTAPEDEWEIFEYDVTATHFESFVDLSNLHVLSNAPLLLTAEHGEVHHWLREYVHEHGIKYVFLDPLYMLTDVEYETKSGAIRPLLEFFTRLKSEQDCAVVVTHHQTAKHATGSAASRLLGDTYIFGWYESALFTTRAGTLFKLEVDAMRELGVEQEFTLTGLGVGKWTLDEHVQGLTDSLGRTATTSKKKEANVSALGRLLEENPHLTNKQAAAVLGVTQSSIKNYKAALRGRQEASR